MTAKEFLQQYAEADSIAKRLKSEYEIEEMMIDSIRSPLSGDGTPRGGGISRTTEDKAVELADQLRVWKDAEIEALRIRQRVFNTIRDIPGVEGQVLYERYILLKTWIEVAIEIHYSLEGAFAVHRRALDIVEEKIKRFA